MFSCFEIMLPALLFVVLHKQGFCFALMRHCCCTLQRRIGWWFIASSLPLPHTLSLHPSLPHYPPTVCSATGLTSSLLHSDYRGNQKSPEFHTFPFRRASRTDKVMWKEGIILHAYQMYLIHLIRLIKLTAWPNVMWIEAWRQTDEKGGVQSPFLSSPLEQRLPRWK